MLEEDKQKITTALRILYKVNYQHNEAIRNLAHQITQSKADAIDSSEALEAMLDFCKREKIFIPANEWE